MRQNVSLCSVSMPMVRVLENYLMNTRYFCDRVGDISITLPATLLCSFPIPVVKVLGGHGVRFYWPCSPVFFLGPKFPFVYLAAIGGWSIEARLWLWAVLPCGPSVLLSLWPCFLGSVGCSLLAGLQAYGLSPCWELIPPAQKLYHGNVFCDMLLYYEASFFIPVVVITEESMWQVRY